MMKVTNDFYRQFEELNNWLDSLLQENKLLRKEFKLEKRELKETINSLTKQLEEANKLIKKIKIIAPRFGLFISIKT